MERVQCFHEVASSSKMSVMLLLRLLQHGSNNLLWNVEHNMHNLDTKFCPRKDCVLHMWESETMFDTWYYASMA